MRPFRFRPQVVLDLRCGEEEAARTALARQRAEVARARALADEAAQTARTADATRAAAAAGASPAQLEWHRSWIVTLRRDLAEREASASTAAEAARVAAAAHGVALQKRRVLERLRERAWRRYRLEHDRDELREMDRLAGLRYFAQTADPGGQHHDDDSDRRDLAVPNGESFSDDGHGGHARPQRLP